PSVFHRFSHSFPTRRSSDLGASTVFFVGVMARRLGGSVFAMALSMTAAIVAPFYLSLDAYYSMNSIDLLVWAAAVWLMIRILQSDRKSTRLNSSHEWISYAV